MTFCTFPDVCRPSNLIMLLLRAASVAVLTLDSIGCHSGAPQRRQVYAACVNLAACGEPGIHNPVCGYGFRARELSSRPGMTERAVRVTTLGGRRTPTAATGSDSLVKQPTLRRPGTSSFGRRARPFPF